MNWRSLFNISYLVPEPAPTRAPGEAVTISTKRKEVAGGVFVTPQSITTFPVATLAASLITRIVVKLQPAWEGSLSVPLAVSCGVGLLIFTIGITDPKARRSTPDILIAFFIGLINTAFLFAAVTGIANDLLRR